MPALSKEIIGSTLESFNMRIEREALQSFCAAIGETNPIYLDRDAAVAAGFRDTPIPPTFQTSFLFKGYGYEKFWETLRSFGIDTNRLLHTKQEYSYFEPVYPDDVITGKAEIIEVRTGKLEMATLKTVYRNQEDKVCIEEILGIMIRPEGM